LQLVQTDFTNAVGSVTQKLIEWNTSGMGLPSRQSEVIINVYARATTTIAVPGGKPQQITWKSGTVQACPLSGTLSNICLEPFLRELEHERSPKQRFSIVTKVGGDQIHVNIAAYADDLILHSSMRVRIYGVLEALADFCDYVKKCVSIFQPSRGGQ
jgi:hypothetical protein